MGNSSLPPGGHPPSKDTSAQTRAAPDAERRARLDDIGFRAVAVQLPASRRDAGVRQALRDRILSEFREMPGMTLTVPQAARLLGRGSAGRARPRNVWLILNVWESHRRRRHAGPAIRSAVHSLRGGARTRRAASRTPWQSLPGPHGPGRVTQI